eukprot:9063816-Heterocapsa_arctica.AAC.1
MYVYVLLRSLSRLALLPCAALSLLLRFLVLRGLLSRCLCVSARSRLRPCRRVMTRRCPKQSPRPPTCPHP